MATTPPGVAYTASPTRDEAGTAPVDSSSDQLCSGRRRLRSKEMVQLSLVLSPFGCPFFLYLLGWGFVVDMFFWIVTTGAASLFALRALRRRQQPVIIRGARWYIGGVFGCQVAVLVLPNLAKLLTNLETCALHCGVLGAWTAAWSLAPISRASPILTVLGIPVDAALKAHAVLGRATTVFLTCHFLGYCMYWYLDGGRTKLNEELKTWNHEGINNLAGVCGFISLFVAIFLSSLGKIRQLAYEVFYRLHVVGFGLFILFGSMHWDYFPYLVAPSIMLWTADLGRRFLDWYASRTFHLVGRLQAYENNLVHLVLTSDDLAFPFASSSAAAALASSRSGLSVYATLCVPEVSPVQWHVFSLMPGTTNDAWIRARGDWTKRLLAATTVRGGRHDVVVRLGSLSSGGWSPVQQQQQTGHHHHHLFLVAGGTGVVPLLSALDNNDVRLLWCIRHVDDVAILESYGGGGSPKNATLDVRFTGPEDDLPAVNAALNAAAFRSYRPRQPREGGDFTALRDLHAAALVGTILGLLIAHVAVDSATWKIGVTTLLCLSAGAAIATAICAMAWILPPRKKDDGGPVVEMVTNPVITDDVKEDDKEVWSGVTVQHGRPDILAEMRFWAKSCPPGATKTVLAAGPPNLVETTRTAVAHLRGPLLRKKISSEDYHTNLHFDAVSFDMSDL